MIQSGLNVWKADLLTRAPWVEIERGDGAIEGPAAANMSRVGQQNLDTVTVQASVMQNFSQLDRVMDASPPLPLYHHRQGVLAVLTSGRFSLFCSIVLDNNH